LDFSVKRLWTFLLNGRTSFFVFIGGGLIGGGEAVDGCEVGGCDD
jgi:hypothetical protein